MPHKDPAKRTEAKRRYRESHREELREKGREYMRKRLEDPAYRAEHARKAREKRVGDPERYRAEHRRRYSEDPERHREYARRHREKLGVEEMTARRNAAKAQNPEIRKRNAQVAREWRERNPEKQRAANRNTHATYRARKRNAPIVEKIDRMVIYERDGGVCHICRKPTDVEAFHLDHVFPLSRGGTHTADNVAVAHPFCNISKGAKLLEEVAA